VTSITTELTRLSGPLAYLVVAALVFGECAIFLGFLIPSAPASPSRSWP
jgi:membrane protein DedA with SNARE-associated domain